MAVYSWPQVANDCGVLFYQIERETPNGYEVVAKIPNRTDHELFDLEKNKFFFRDVGSHTLRVAAVSDAGIGQYSYIFPPEPLPAPPIPSLEIQRPTDPSNFKLEISPKWKRIQSASRFGASISTEKSGKNNNALLLTGAILALVLLNNGRRKR